MEKALLRLFNAVKVDNKESKNIDQATLERTISEGYVLHPSIIPYSSTLDAIEEVVGLSGEKANNAFHKSWEIIENTPQEELWLQAIVHYFTTYGFEFLGIYNSDSVYIPHEELDLPDLTEDLPLVVIKGLTKEDILQNILDLASGIALSEQTLQDIITVIKACGFAPDYIDQIKNRELKIRLYDHYGITPTEPVEFLRYVISKLTGESLLIKNKDLIEKIKASKNAVLLDKYLEQAPTNLASIFLRYKPLFLALKKVSKKKYLFNRWRKQANYMHQPLPTDYLNNVTSQIKNGDINLTTLADKLATATLWRKVRLAYALKFRLNDPGAIVYKVRNGKGYAQDFEWLGNSKITEQALDLVLESIANNLDLRGQLVYIPENITYTLPATEKQFIGNFPCGTYVSVPEDLVVGVHWCNLPQHRVDLDLSVIDGITKIGWDSGYSNASKQILFSGDMTDAPAPKGASELFYVKSEISGAKILIANYFNYSTEPVPCKIFAAHEKIRKIRPNYMVDVNNMIAAANIQITKRQNVLGLITAGKFYFSNVSVGNSISSSYTESTARTRQYLVDSVVNSITLEEVLRKSGAYIFREKPEEDFIDLSPENLDKTTILNLLSK
jgi:hypothetical protein